MDQQDDAASQPPSELASLVTETRTICFFPGTQFEEAIVRQPSLGWDSYDEYLQDQEDFAAALSGQGLVLIIREIDWARLDEWAAQVGADPYAPEALSAFPGLEHLYDGPGTLLAIHMSDAALRLALQCATNQGIDIDDALQTTGQVWQELRYHWTHSVTSSAHLHFATMAAVSGRSFPIATNLDVHIDENAELALATTAHVPMLENLLLLGCVNGAGLILRADDPVDTWSAPSKPGQTIPQTIYGWTIGPAGLTGLSAAALFDACCITPEGDVLPPEEKIQYSSTI